MQEHTPVSPGGAPCRDVLVAFTFGEAPHQCLDAPVAVATQGEARHTVARACGRLRQPWPNRSPTCCLHLMRQPGCLDGASCRWAFVLSWQVPGPVASTCSCSSRNVPPLRRPRSILKLSHPGCSDHPGAARAVPDEARRLCGFIMLRPKAGSIEESFFYIKTPLLTSSR